MIILPATGDNAAIATRRLEPGETFGEITILQTVLEGHRVAAKKIEAGEPILSWGLPFGRALKPIAPGEYLANARILEVLQQRHVDFKFPAEPNFENRRLEFHYDEKTFHPGEQTSLHANPGTFEGYLRGSNRGAGTRNFLVVLATSSRANSVARAIAGGFRNQAVIAVTHTEGSTSARANNFEMTVRTLKGFLTNPNVAAFVAVDLPGEALNNRLFEISDPPGVFVSIAESFESAVAHGKRAVETLLPGVLACQRTRVPLAYLKIGLQCGGSDAFSGVSANPLVGWMSRETVRHGGAANLAETTELIGAENYILRNVRDLATARSFLAKLDRYSNLAAWHGHSAEGNPSGGNLLRGLYNITLKSIGAALKKSGDTRVDYVIDYGEPMNQPGFYFMDSPGNDLESIAGQVASGCNMILFTTGNGSITNFPFVPTIKVMTTTGRFKMLQREMDFNAGRYLDGEPREALGKEAFDLMLRVASGEASAGEKAGHAQTQLWRDWRQTGPNGRLTLPPPPGKPLPINGGVLDLSGRMFKAFKTPRGWATQQRNLIVPTSLCSGQVGVMIASARALQPCVALPHTEGCGNSCGESERLMLRTLAGYAIHPLTARALMLEHGCEKTHNDAFRAILKPEQIEKIGWASIQLDGGIEGVTRKAISWFNNAGTQKLERENAPISALRVGFASAGGSLPESFMLIARSLAAAGALAVIPEFDLESATIDYGQPALSHGFHTMRTPTDHFVEIISGLGATGVELILVWTPDTAVQGHPFVPVYQIGPAGADLRESSPEAIIALILRAASGEQAPALASHSDFQITRGLEGLSL